MEKITKLIAGAGLLAYLIVIAEAIRTQIFTWIPDAVISFFFLGFCLWKWKELHLTNTIFLFVLLSFFLHNAGVFGFYGSSPLPIAWDHVTHFVGLFAAGIFFFNFFEDKFKKGKMFNNIFLLFIVLLVSLGIGSLIENLEFGGYLFLGEGEGGLYFGEGDAAPGVDTDMRNIAGGGWFNAMWDLVFNLLGALAAIIAMLIHRHMILKK